MGAADETYVCRQAPGFVREGSGPLAESADPPLLRRSRWIVREGMPGAVRWRRHNTGGLSATFSELGHTSHFFFASEKHA